jgi:Pyruvate/2-oxoacid:ferredoxin oxidoreductase delta subunit
MSQPERILYCHCARAKVLPAEATAAALDQLCALGLSFEAVPDLCDLAARQDPRLRQTIPGGSLRIAACHPRAVKWLVAAANTPAPRPGVEAIDLRSLPPDRIRAALVASHPTPIDPLPGEAEPEAGWRLAEAKPGVVEILSGVGAGAGAKHAASLAQLCGHLLESGWAVSLLAKDHAKEGARTEAGVRAPAAGERLNLDGQDARRILARLSQAQPAGSGERPEDWPAWFPVIDFDRCTHCMQCLSFCLFDVYGASPEGSIQVRNATNCKTNCPACSRVCPEAAILFPKHPAGPINGQEPAAGETRREVKKVDISLLLGGDLYSTLRTRNAQGKDRFSKQRDPALALEERRRCLAQLASAGDIPPEVLMSLPSPEEIQRRAQKAAARAQAALANRSPEKA